MFNKVKSAALAGMLIAASALPSLAAGDAGDKSLAGARDNMKKGQYAKVVQDMSASVQKDPGSSEAHLLLGQAYCKMHNYAKARDQLRLAIRTGHATVKAQKANALLMTLPKQFLSPKTGPNTRMIATLLGLTATRGGPARPTIIDFYAPWCVPCKQLDAVLAKVKTQYGEQINFVTVNVDDPSSGKLIDQYEVSPIPTLIFLNAEGEVVTYTIGYSGDTIVASSVKKILPAQS
ncbi:MAG TPA: thioredoxin domain-containing protein [Planktothrix sp.]|jgi:thioredoxin 1